VFGAEGPEAEAYARTLGLALQTTNIARDLRADAEEGRIYVPTEMLSAAGVDPRWLRGDGPPEVYAPDGPVARLVRDLVTLARQRFSRAAELLPASQRRVLLPAEIMAAVYAELLERVAERGGRLDRPDRPRVPRARKLWLALRTWWRGCR
jgi:phytoene synthase